MNVTLTHSARLTVWLLYVLLCPSFDTGTGDSNSGPQAAEGDPELLIFPPLPPWDYKKALPCLVCAVPGFEPKALRVVGKDAST